MGYIFSISYIYMVHSGGFELIAIFFVSCFLLYKDFPPKGQKLADMCLAIAGALNIYSLLFLICIKKAKRVLKVIGFSTLLSGISIFILNRSFISFKIYLSDLLYQCLDWKNIIVLLAIFILLTRKTYNPTIIYYVLFFVLCVLWGENISAIGSYVIFPFILVDENIPFKKVEGLEYIIFCFFTLGLLFPFWKTINVYNFILYIGLIIFIVIEMINKILPRSSMT